MHLDIYYRFDFIMQEIHIKGHDILKKFLSHCRKIELDSELVQTFRIENLRNRGKTATGPELKWQQEINFIFVRRLEDFEPGFGCLNHSFTSTFQINNLWVN